MPRPGGGSIGHSKHRKAFGTKCPKSGFGRILLQKQMDRAQQEGQRVREVKRAAMFGSVRELFDCGG